MRGRDPSRSKRRLGVWPSLAAKTLACQRRKPRHQQGGPGCCGDLGRERWVGLPNGQSTAIRPTVSVTSTATAILRST